MSEERRQELMLVVMSLLMGQTLIILGIIIANLIYRG